MRRLSISILLLFAACRGRDATAATRRTAARDTVPDTVPDTLKAKDSARVKDSAAAKARDTAIVRALYVNRWASQSAKKMKKLIAIADSTEINALVIDMKDEFGLNFTSKDTLVSRNAGKSGKVQHLDALLDSLRAHHILAIARVVVFKDSVAARMNPKHVIQRPDGKPWQDKKGLTWVDPYDKVVWEYNIRVAEELGHLGFGEIQFDYIRFPEPYKSLPEQVFKDANGVPKPRALANFLRVACPRIHAKGARCTADIFGMVTTVPGALEIGQEWSELAPVTDVLLPMVYPSHYPPMSFGVAHPNGAPYIVVDSAVSGAHRHDHRLGITNDFHVRPWLQAFTLGAPHYGAKEVAEQKRAVYDAGFDSWTLWSPGSDYTSFLPALEKSTVSRRKSGPPGTPVPAAAPGRARR
jgi:hypothetical protein